MSTPARPNETTTGDEAMVPIPTRGRVFSAKRRVRLGDVSPKGRLRLDAVARYIQDTSNDDTVDAGLRDDMSWVVRKTLLHVHQEAELREELILTTFCGGIGGRWAERRVSIEGDKGAHLEASTLWVHLDAETGRPKKLPRQFHDIYDEAAGGRVARARLTHTNPTNTPTKRVNWPLRFSDFDVLGHVNNAIAWAVVEEERSSGEGFALPYRAETEYRLPLERGNPVEYWVTTRGQANLQLWLMNANTISGTNTSAEVGTAEVSVSAIVTPLVVDQL